MNYRPRRALGFLLAAFVSLSLAFSIIVPLGEAPDEVSHLSYIQYLRDHAALPPPSGPVAGESHQPPLYYTIAALVTLPVPVRDFEPIANPDFVLDDPQTPNLLLHPRSEGFPFSGFALSWHLARALSVLLGAITVCATWRIALLLVDDELVALGAAAFVAFLPGFVHLSGMVNNDNLIITLTGLGILQIVRMLKGAEGWGNAALLGALLGLAALTKLSGFVLWPFALLVLGWHSLHGDNRSRGIQQVVVALVIAVGIATPWAIYNLLTAGDPLGWARTMAVTPVRQAPPDWYEWGKLLTGLFTSGWGRFGGAVQLRLAEPFYLVGLVAVGIPLGGWLLHLREDGFKHKPGLLLTLGLFGLFWGIMLAAHVRWSLAVLGTDQGRQLYPGLPLLAALWSAGLVRLLRVGKTNALAIAGMLVIPACALYALLMLQSVFAPPIVSADTLSLNQTAPIEFGKTIRLAGYSISPTLVSPGSKIIVATRWQSVEPTAQDYWLLLQLDDQTETVARKDGVPSAGRVTTDWWQPGQLYASSHTLTLPEDISPGTYTLRLGLHPFGRWEWLTVQGQDTAVLGRIVVTR